MAELHLVLPVRALFGGQAALVHGVGQIQELKGLVQISAVGSHLAHAGPDAVDIDGQRGNGAHVLGDGADIKRAAPGLEADEDIDQSGENGEYGLTETGIYTALALAMAAATGPSQPNTEFPFQ